MRVLLTGDRACRALLLFWYPLLLLWRALVPILIAVFVVEEALQGLHGLRLLVLDILLVGVARKVDSFTFAGLLHSGA